MNSDPLIERLTSIVGGDHVLVDPALCGRYETDLTRRWSGRARAVVRPADVNAVAAVLATCHAAGAPVVPQGGHTGMVGGATPRDGEVVLSLERLDWLGEVDTFEKTILVGAGATLEMVQDLAQRHGLFLPLDLGARGTATIGGMTATNAGGAKAIRYGTMSEHVVGIQAVLADGRIVDRSNPLRKDNAGFAWHKLVPGTEGTLCVITSARLRLMPSLPRKATALCGLESVAAGVELCRALQMLAPDLEAADFFDEASLALACARRGLSKPFEDDFPFYVVVDVATAADPVEQLGAAFAHSGHDSNVLFSDDPRGRIGLWAYREVLNEAVSSGGVPLKLDVGLPIHALEAFTKQCASLCARASARPNLYLWGHLGDGNVHVNIVGAGADESELAEEVLRLVAAAGGTVSAEHGIGRAKTEWLHLTRSPAELDLIRAIKHAFDPSGLLSPGRVFAIGGREGEYRGSPQPR